MHEMNERQMANDEAAPIQQNVCPAGRRHFMGWKRFAAGTLAVLMLASTPLTGFAADNDGWTEGKTQIQGTGNGTWTEWVKDWETVKNNYEQLSITPGADETELNFAWYSENTATTPKVMISLNREMTNAKTFRGARTKAIDGYVSNKVTVRDLEAGKTYYYQYSTKKDGKEELSPVAEYKTQQTGNFSFLYVGDPQIGSSEGNIASGETTEQGQDKAVRNDSYNWSNTLNRALEKNSNPSFVISAGDQIQSRDKKNPGEEYTKNEIEYAGYLSPNALKSLAVATTVGNHDAPSPNYSYHFNNPNASSLGATEGTKNGDYYFSYGDSLFIMLNTNNYNISEHKKLINQAIASHKDAAWKIVTLHQDIYGSGEHSNEPEIVNLRYNLIPVFEDADIDVVLTGHDHTYTRSYIMKGASKDNKVLLDDDTFGDEFEKQLEGKETTQAYKNYLQTIMDKENVESTANKALNPEGILYMTANSASGSKYYDLVEEKQSYVASRWQQDVPTYSVVSVGQNTFTIDTYRTDTNQKIDDTFTIVKAEADKTQLQNLLNSSEVTAISKNENDYTTDTYAAFENALKAAKAVNDNKRATEDQIAAAMADLNKAISGMVKKVPAAQTVVLTKKATSLYVGQSKTVTATVYPLEANQKVTWKSSNTKVAKVTSTGKITGVKKGTASVTATAHNGKKRTVKVTVSTKKIPSKKVTLNKKKLTLKKGKTYTLKAKMTPGNTTDSVTFTTSKKSVVKVVNKKTGKIKAVKKGTAKIKVKTSSGKTATCTVKVK